MNDPLALYTIETDQCGLNADLAPELVAAAAVLPTVPSTFDRTVGETQAERRRVTTECVRCTDDDVVIWPDDLVQRVAHLTLCHGYRMDGRRYDGANQVVYS